MDANTEQKLEEERASLGGEIFRAGPQLLSGKATISLTSDRPTKLLSQPLCIVQAPLCRIPGTDQIGPVASWC